MANTPSLTEDEIAAIGRKQGQRHGKQDAGREFLEARLLADTVRTVSERLARSTDKAEIISEEAYLLGYVRAWGERIGRRMSG